MDVVKSFAWNPSNGCKTVVLSNAFADSELNIHSKSVCNSITARDVQPNAVRLCDTVIEPVPIVQLNAVTNAVSD